MSKEALLVVGSSGSGKSSLIRSLRNPEYLASLAIPVRYTTRPPRRNNEDYSENMFVSHDTFAQKAMEGKIYPYWRRQLAGMPSTHYGFASTNQRLGRERFKIYSANNALLRDKNCTVQEVLGKSLVLMVTADRAVREERLLERSRDMSATERDARLDDVLDLPSDLEAVEVIDTTEATEADSQRQFKSLVDSLLQAFWRAAVR
jgi:ribose 1,5-bisphosphokinase PhnN